MILTKKQKTQISKRLEELTVLKEKLPELVNDLFWDYQRMSSSGKETLDKIAVLVGVPTDEEIEKASKETT